MDYICIGQSTLDYNWSVPQIPATGKKVFAGDFRPGGGGMAATAAVAIARLGGQVAFWGRAGDDTAGHIMRDELGTCGVNVEQFRLLSGARSPVAAVLVDSNGERQISTFRGDLPEDPSWLALRQLKQCRAVMADMRWPAGAVEVFACARSLGIPTILDGDIADTDDYPRLLEQCDYALFSSNGLSAFAPDSDINNALTLARQYGCKVAGVTNGSEGTAWLDDHGLHCTPAIAVDAIDTTGAGDVFHGAFTLRIGEGYSSGDAIEFATAAAALKCCKRGAREGIPDREALDVFMEKYK